MTLASTTRVLIVEDEAIIAMTAEDSVEALGAVVTRSAATLAEALAAIEMNGFDVAMLDVNLNGELSLPAARRLLERGIPFIFTTGYDRSVIGSGFEGIPVVRKPYTTAALGEALAGVRGAAA